MAAKGLLALLWVLTHTTAQAWVSTTAPLRTPQVVLRSLHNDASAESLDRRQLFRSAAAAAVATIWLPSVANAAASLGSSPEHPIVVLGAGGKVGKLCCQILQQQGRYVKAVTRSGKSLFPQDSHVSYAAGDVTQLNSLEAAVAGSSGVIFAASASGAKKGGDPAHVDYLGVANTATACLAAQVPKLVVVSAACVTRPQSPGFKATNYFVNFIYGERIMDYKVAGEAVVRNLYSNAKGSSYCIVRPGGLSDGPAVGPSKLHVSQGDVYSAEISRSDVAQLAVAALDSATTDNTTIEINNVAGLVKTEETLPDLPATLVHTGADSYAGLLQGLVKDGALQKQIPDIFSDFTGEGIKSLDSLRA
jgi:uncharacterized protein YbjT (DUF2867 family)